MASAAVYQLMVARDAGFNDVVSTATIYAAANPTSPSAQLSLPLNSSFYWQVRAGDGNNNWGPWSTNNPPAVFTTRTEVVGDVVPYLMVKNWNDTVWVGDPTYPVPATKARQQTTSALTQAVFYV